MQEVMRHFYLIYCIEDGTHNSPLSLICGGLVPHHFSF